MSLATALDNLLAVGLQGLWIVGAALLLARVFPLERPSLALRWWQAILAGVVALPLLQPWSAAPGGRGETWLDGLAVPSGAAGPSARRWPVQELAASVLLCGSGARLAWLLVGLRRLRRFGARGRPLDPEADGLVGLQRRLGVRAEFLLCDDVRVPATFGWRRPVVLLPPAFRGMSPEGQTAVAAHELVHVQRGDWAATVAEEALAAALWFLPAVGFALSRVRLAREQVVDAVAVGALGRRDVYLESLVEMARHLLPARPVPAALLLREHHLRDRVELLLKEVTMSKARSLSHGAASAAALLLAGAVGALAFPLVEGAAPDKAKKEEKAKVPEPRLLHKVDTAYPEEAKKEKVEGLVHIAVHVGKDGAVEEAKVADGHALLAEAALLSVRQWRWAPTLGPDKEPVEVDMTITINFRLD